MSKVLGLIALLYTGLALAVVSCGNKASDAKERTAPATASASNVSDQNSPSAQAYAQLRNEVMELQKQATTQEQVMEAMKQTISKLDAFIAKYPGSKESSDAGYQMALIHSSLGEFDQAISGLEQFIRTGDEADEEVGYAHFFLAEAYKNLDRYDDAIAQYKLFVDKYSQLNPRFLAAATAALDDIPSLRQLAVGNDPIAFKVKDIKGKTLSLDDFKGKVVLLDFWATWCLPCKVEMPNVIRIHKKFNQQGFEIIGISLDSDRQALESFIRTNGIGWPQYFDGKGWQNGVAEKYKVRSIPATFLIDKKGKIRFRSLRGGELEKAVEKLLDEA